MSAESILRAAIEGEELVVRIGIDTLAFAVGQGNGIEPGVKVTDKVEFAYWVARHIVEYGEDETGTGALGRLLDSMAVEAQESAETCVADPDPDPEYGTGSAK